MVADTQGVDFSLSNLKSINFQEVFVAKPSDGQDLIGQKLQSGLHLVLSPGTYNLTRPLVVSHDNQVVLGLGMVSLNSIEGTPLIHVTAAGGVRIAGVILEAPQVPWRKSRKHRGPLLLWGASESSTPGNMSNPSSMHDVFIRIGGPAITQQTKPVYNSEAAASGVAMMINAGYVIGDNLWLCKLFHLLLKWSLFLSQRTTNLCRARGPHR